MAAIKKLLTLNVTPNTCDLVAYDNQGAELWRVQGKLEKDGKSYKFPTNEAGIVYKFTSVVKEGGEVKPKEAKNSGKKKVTFVRVLGFADAIRPFGELDEETKATLKVAFEREQARKKDEEARAEKLKELKKLQAKAAKLQAELGE